MLTNSERLQCEKIRQTREIVITINPDTDEQMTLRFGERYGHDIRNLRHDIRLAIQDYFNNKPKL